MYVEIDFVAKNWDILPKYKPEESTNLSIAERMAELEAKLTTQSQTRSELKAQSLVTNDKVKTIHSDCAAHEQQLQQILTSVILTKSRESTPTAAQVLRNSISQSVTPATSQSGGGSY